MQKESFRGCKVALFYNDQLLVYRRDDRDDIASPGAWDLPGGGREGSESPEECVLRELLEEFGIALARDRLFYRRRYAIDHAMLHAYFFVGKLYAGEVARIVFGDEGQFWTMMPVAEYQHHPDAVDAHQRRLADYFASLT